MYERGKFRFLSLLFSLLMAFSLVVPTYGVEERPLIPLGKAVGIKLFADGALVVAVEDSTVLQKGDVLLKLDGEEINSTEEVQSLLREKGGAVMTMEVQRGERILSLADSPRQGADGVWRLGVWIRDSMAGVGTVTYYDPATQSYGALGHGITDVDTAQLMTLQRGAIMPTTIKAVKRGAAGEPGELKGDFSVQRDIATMGVNSSSGIFGTVTDTAFFLGTPMAVAAPHEVRCGEATILSTVWGDETREYAIEIKKVYENGKAGRDLLLQVKDEALLSKTGGIVQGMSGSPILQNGKIVGAVTHVLVNDPTGGYGIFIEKMLAAG